jgi:ribosomal protein S18 acetylase RimI-like enzyme
MISFELDYINNENRQLLKKFDCGHEGLNNFLVEQAEKYGNEKVGTTQLILNEDNRELIGYFTLRNTALMVTIDDKLRGEPAIEIMMLAIDEKYQNRGIGSDILNYLMMNIYQYSIEFAATKMVVLHSLKRCIGFYEKQEFMRLEWFMQMLYDSCQDNCVSMYYNMLRYGR